jgi:putative ABC transport system substrate-binding protein
MTWRIFSLSLLVFALAAMLTSCGLSVEGESKHFTIGLATNNINGLRNVYGFIAGMAELGYIEGENVTYIFRDEAVKGADLDAYLASMVEAEADLIFTAGTPTGVAVHAITAGSGIPVVFGVIADPIAAGVMEDLSQPGGNLTGVMLSTNQTRRLELLLEAAPFVKHIYTVYNPNDSAATSALDQITNSAPDLGVNVDAHPVTSEEEVLQAFANLPKDIDAIFLLPDSLVNAHIETIVDIALENKLPLCGPSNTQVEQGALIGFGIIHQKVGEQAAYIADQILSGSDPGSLPVETADFYLALNLVTANRIDLEMPYSILQQAEIIIREDE